MATRLARAGRTSSDIPSSEGRVPPQGSLKPTISDGNVRARARSMEVDNGTAEGKAGSPRPMHRPRRSTRRQSEEDDGFHKKWEGVERKEEKSRAELLGVSEPRLPKAAIRKMAKGDPRIHDPDSDDPLQRATLEELEQLALDKSKEVTSDLRAVLKVTKETEAIGAQTLEALQAQGEQIARTQEKAVQLDQELAKGETLLSKLGPMFSFGWKPKKGKKITGATYQPAGKNSKFSDMKNRKDLTAAELREMEDDESLGKMERVKKQMNQQDEMLDEVSASLDVMKDMANEMGGEMDKQDKAIDDLTGDVDELNSRLKQSNQRGKKLLGK